VILVTGATGKLGSAVVEQLRKLVPSEQVIAAARTGSVSRADYDDPKGLAQSFRGVERLLLVSASGIAREERFRLHRNAIDAALRCGVAHLYYTSLAFGDHSVAEVMQAHLDTESYLRASGLGYTILRNQAYAEGWKLYLGEQASVPADGPVAWASRDDLAEATARLLAKGSHRGETVILSGPKALTLSQTAALVLPEQTFRIVSEAEFIEGQIASGKTPEFARAWTTSYRAIARGELAKVDPTLQQILQRPLCEIG
jgi:uncharacterized protein YbjT (DUF2867 family)